MGNDGHKVLIIDDEELIRKVIIKELKNSGIGEVLEAEDAKSGFDMAIKEEPALILLDLRLPDEDGISMLRRLREHEWGKHVPVIIISNLAEQEKKDEAKKYGATEYIVKADLSLSELVKLIKAAIG